MNAPGCVSRAQPLTEAQEGLWYVQALDPKNPILNTGQYLDLRGPLDRAALDLALARTIAESEALHLRFRSGPDGPEQWQDTGGITPLVVDLTDHPTPEAEALAWMERDSERPLDLAHDPVAAFTLFIIGNDRHLLYERIHHLAIDGYGMVLVTNRIGDHYSAIVSDGTTPAPLPPLSRCFDEDAAWRASDRRAVDAAWWRSEMANLPEVTGPAAGRAISAHRFIRESQWLAPDLAAQMAARSDALRVGWPDLLTALVGAYLARWTGGEAVIGLPFMARMGRRIARVPCMAMNVLPHRIRPDEDAPLSEWLTAATARMQEARRHGLYRSEYLRRDLGLVGGTRRLYGPLINVQPFDRPPVFAGLGVGLHILGAGTVDDLTITFRGDPKSGILFEVDANPELYTTRDIAGHGARLTQFITAALSAENLAAVPTASPDEVAAIVARGAATKRSLPDVTLSALIEAQMRATPSAPALTFGGETISYADLDRRSAALARALTDRGVGPGVIVAVALDRSISLPLALVAVLRAGGAYLPLDPDHPAERIARILTLSKPAVVLTSGDLAHLLSPDTALMLTDDWPVDGDAPPCPARPDDMAYVIFTSGSTGEPKGVVIEQRAIVNRLEWMRTFYGFDATDRILQKTPATFDVSVWEFFLPMICGAELVVAAPGAHRDPRALAATIRDHAITTAHFVPSMLSAFLAAPASDGIVMRRVFCSGEELTPDQRDRFHRRIDAELHNLYGPTEAAVDVSFWPAAPDDHSNPVPIGWPVWNTRLEVLDDRMRPVPPGLAGNLYLGGVQLARGYLGRDDLTNERFIPDPARPGERLYAAGDLARLRDDGAVVYLGRSDNQVKIRGLRIELGEVEAAIMATGLARECVVIAREDRGGDKRLVAYLVPTEAYAPGLVAERIGTSLPAYMLPSAEVALPEMPVTSNGKLDRKALPAPDLTTKGRDAETPTERLLAALFAEILHLPAPAPAEADFFALGGDSLSAVRLALRLEEETGRDPGLGTIFEHPVLLTLASALDRQVQDDGLGPVILLADGDPDASPLFLVHPAGGIAWGYRALAREIAPDRRVFGLQHPGLDPDVALPDSLATLARDYAARVREIAPVGPVHLAGWSVGGLIAQEMAVELSGGTHSPGVVALLDSYPADVWRDEPEPDPAAALRALLAIAGHDPEAHHDLDSRAKVVAFLRAGESTLGALPDAVLDGVVRTVTDTNRLVRGHHHRRLATNLLHIRAALDHQDRDLGPMLWTPYAAEIEVEEVPTLHAAMTSASVSQVIAAMLRRRMTD